ncbi:MAG TPA: hypothetical protein VKX17_03810 [Planctomycetota bacterium]|nr:hypothetical protein [Planctomycetota bacterium]
MNMDSFKESVESSFYSIHEAAHAVMHFLFGNSINYVSWRLRCCDPADDPDMSDKQWIQTLQAGSVAWEIKFPGSSSSIEESHTQDCDHDQIAERTEYLVKNGEWLEDSVENELLKLKEDTRRMLSEPIAWQAVEKIAHEMCERKDGFLNGKSARLIFDSVVNSHINPG